MRHSVGLAVCLGRHCAEPSVVNRTVPDSGKSLFRLLVSVISFDMPFSETLSSASIRHKMISLKSDLC